MGYIVRHTIQFRNKEEVDLFLSLNQHKNPVVSRGIQTPYAVTYDQAEYGDDEE